MSGRFTFAVGRYRCTITLPATLERGTVIEAPVEWWPRVPRRLSPSELTAYQRGRDRALAEFLGPDRMGAVVEVAPDAGRDE